MTSMTIIVKYCDMTIEFNILQLGHFNNLKIEAHPGNTVPVVAPSAPQPIAPASKLETTAKLRQYNTAQAPRTRRPFKRCTKLNTNLLPSVRKSKR